jgi:tetratricopeptide (TPR) repeat protein
MTSAAVTTVITLSVTELPGTSSDRLFQYQTFLDDRPLGTNRTLSPAETKEMIDLAKQHSELFEQEPIPQLGDADARVFGDRLFNLWLDSVWPQLKDAMLPGVRRLLVIASVIPEVLNLPWELIWLPSGAFIGLDSTFSIRRLPQTRGQLVPPPELDSLPPSPLRIVFMSCAPRDEAILDYEREEEAILEAIGPVGPSAVLDSCDYGTFDELRQHINEVRPQIVHLSGHAVVDDEVCYFEFEDESGTANPVPAGDLKDLLAGSGVQCVFFSGCQTALTPISVLGGLCQSIVTAGLPLAIGWAASIADDIAIQFARQFYQTLASGQPVDRALTQARQRIHRDQEDDASWTLPALYAASRQEHIFDTNPQRATQRPRRAAVVQQPLPGMTEGYAQHFVGRRRELQRLLPALRSGKCQTALLTGLGGSGKSTLATRLARKLEVDGFLVIPVPSPQSRQLTAGRILDECRVAFRQYARQQKAQGELAMSVEFESAADDLDNPKISLNDRQRGVISSLNRGRFLLVLDNFETNLDEATLRILDPDLTHFFTHVLSDLLGESRLVITCRYLPADAGPLPAHVLHESLKDFPEADFIKYLLRDPEVEQRYYREELPHERLVWLHELFGGTPRFLAQIRTVLRTISATELSQDVAQVPVASDLDPSVLQARRDQYCQQIFTDRLYRYLTPAAQRALTRAAVFRIPVDLDALAAVTGESASTLRSVTKECETYAFATSEQNADPVELWTIYSLLRAWLLAPERLRPEELRDAHRAAADFFVDLQDKGEAARLGLSDRSCVLEARSHYLAAGEFKKARSQTGRISDLLVRSGQYPDLEQLNTEMLTYEDHPAPMVSIGQSYYNRGQRDTARDWFRRALATPAEDAASARVGARLAMAGLDMADGNVAAARAGFEEMLSEGQQTNETEIELGAWHGLGRCDIVEGKVNAGREKTLKALEKFEPNDRTKEKAGVLNQLAECEMYRNDFDAAVNTYRQALEINWEQRNYNGTYLAYRNLGMVLYKSGRPDKGALLVTICFMAERALGHGAAPVDGELLNRMIRAMHYGPEQVDQLQVLAREAHNADMGRQLVEQIFQVGPNSWSVWGPGGTSPS